MSELEFKRENLPKGWINLRIKDVVHNSKQDIVDGPFGSNLKASEYVHEGIPLIRLQNIERNHFIDKNTKYITKKKFQLLKRHNFLQEDIVITKLGVPVGKACIVPSFLKTGIIVADIIRIRMNNEFMSKKFLTYMINSNMMIRQFSKHTKGTTRSRVNLTIFRNFQIIVPPLNEQKRIVQKIESIFSQIDAGKERLEKIRVLLKQNKKSVLNDVFNGLNKNKIQKLIDLTTKVTDGTHFTPKYENYGIPFLSVKDIKNEKISFDNCKYISKKTHKNLIKRCHPEFGDLLITKSGTIGRMAIVETKKPFSLFVSVALIKPKNILDVTYFKLTMYNYFNHIDISQQIKGVVVKNFHLEDIRQVMIPLPPLNEQKRIVQKIESIFDKIDAIEKHVHDSLIKLESLKKSVLKKAFEGNLVPQDPNDEPASVLLERIKQAKLLIRKK